MKRVVSSQGISIHGYCQLLLLSPCFLLILRCHLRPSIRPWIISFYSEDTSVSHTREQRATRGNENINRPTKVKCRKIKYKQTGGQLSITFCWLCTVPIFHALQIRPSVSCGRVFRQCSTIVLHVTTENIHFII